MPRPGSRLGKYEIVGLLRESGTGAVFEAVETSTRVPVAIKTMNPGRARDPGLESTLLRQAELLSRLEHPHVARVTDFGCDRGVVYLVTELLQGEDLAAAIARAPAGLDPAWIVDVLLAACAGVSAAHGAGVAHHNLKPESIFLCGLAEAPSPKVLDFGVATLVAARGHELTSPTAGRATVYFLSPEQVRGEAVDGRSDGFALAVILYHGLTGRVPHQGDSSFAIMSSIASGLFPPPRQLRPDLPAELEAVLMRALASRPVERFPTVHELGRALLAFASPGARERWSKHFLGPAVPVTAPVTSPPPARKPTDLFPSTLGPVPTLIGYRVEAPSAAEMTERVPAPRPFIWRRTVVTALVLGAVAGALLSLPGRSGLIEWGRKARAVWRSEPKAPAAVSVTPRITIQAVPRPPAPVAPPPDTAPAREEEPAAAPTGLATGSLVGPSPWSSRLSEARPPTRSAARSKAAPASKRGKAAKPPARTRPRRGSRR